MKRSWYLHPIIWGRRDRDALSFIIFIKFLLKLKDSLSFWRCNSLFNLPSVRYRLFSMMCCVSSDTGISPPPSTPVEHCMNCFFNIPLLKFNPLDLHFMYFRSEARHPVFVNCLCLCITWSKSLWMNETSMPLDLVTTGPAAWGLLGRHNTSPLHVNRGQLDL